MKGIYIALTHTGTLLSKIIKSFTKDEFSHVSIALDIDLNEMYSFGRLKPYNTFIAGFVHEYINKGTFKRFYKTKTRIYYLEVTDEQYEKIKDIIEQMKQDKDNYKFNILGLFAAGFHKRIHREHSFYCAEFVKYVLEQAGVQTNLPSVPKPEDFKNIENMEEIYAGPLRKYKSSRINVAKLIEANLLLYSKTNEIV